MPFPKEVLSNNDVVTNGQQNVFGVNGEYLIVQGRFFVSVQGYDEKLELQVWVRIEGEEFLSMHNQEGHTRSCKGRLIRNLPFRGDGKGEVVICKFHSTNDPMIIPIILPDSHGSALSSFISSGLSSTKYNEFYGL